MDMTCIVTKLTQLQDVVASLRSQALKPGSHNAAGSHRLTRELSELGSSTSGRDSQTGEAVMEDPTSVVALLNVAGIQWSSYLHCTLYSVYSKR